MRRFLLTLALVLLGGPVWAERLFTSGFETNNFTTTEWNAASGTPAPDIVTSATVAPNSGTYAARVQAGTGIITRSLPAAVTSGTYFMRAYVRITGTATFDRTILRADNASIGEAWYARVTTANVLRLFNGVSDTVVVTGPTLSANTWYRVEVRVLLSDTVGELELLVDGTSYGSQTGADTLNTNMIRFICGTPEGSIGITTYYDDVAINDAAAGVQTSFPGAGKIALLKPTAEGATINYTPLSGTDNALMVDDVPGAPDDATTANTSTTAAHVDRLVLSNMPAEVPADADIILVHVLGRVGGNGTTGSPTMQYKLWDEGGTLTDGPACNHVDATVYALETTNHMLVYDAGTKTKANLDSFEAGYGVVVDTSVTQRVTALWVNVEWTEAPAAPEGCGTTIALTGAGCK